MQFFCIFQFFCTKWCDLDQGYRLNKNKGLKNYENQKKNQNVKNMGKNRKLGKKSKNFENSRKTFIYYETRTKLNL